ncbi:very long-chain acyl-CoA synthetase-like [Brienomyrus brachyistius]|uniref:very long-chain acyl-CoA synthetase-like n=1 Tax=Brienomyrus brachyistius TaxID=42636 RepID=UPI0020B3A1AC|nr:very long-chain acyl-CoA synthetase-like [Brienomyrus brachyistius]
MYMYAVTILVSLVFLHILLKLWFPYFVLDCLYVLKTIAFGMRMSKYKKKQPFYTILDCFLDAVRRTPCKPFIIFESRTYSYMDVDKQSNKVARALRIHTGLKQGDTVALFLGNEPCYAWIWLGVAKIGCATALLNCSIRSKSLLHCFSCSGASVLIVAEGLKDVVEEILPALLEQDIAVLILTKGCDTAGMGSLLDKFEEASDEPVSAALRAAVSRKSPALYVYTSGTTGLPKAAVITQERLWVATFIQSLAGVTSKDVLYINLPLYHSAGFSIGFAGAIERGLTIVLRRKFSASKFWDDCRKHNVTVIQYIGETMRYLCNTQKKADDRDHRVRLAIGNGIRADVWKEFLNRFGSIQVRELYAATEGNIGFMNLSGKLGAVGRVNYIHRKIFPYLLIKYDTEKEEPVRNSEGLCVEVLKGETGLLVSKITEKAPFNGYARNLQQTEKKRLRNVLQKGDLYFNSGDLLRIDEDNFIYFQDRIGDTFRWKGENVATTEIADILSMVDCIKEANVYGVRVPDHEGRIGMAAITLKEDKQFDCSSTFSHVASYLPTYARPRFIRIQSQLDITGTYKQKKVKLVDEGFNPAAIQDPLYILDEQEKSYIPMTQKTYSLIASGQMQL